MSDSDIHLGIEGAEFRYWDELELNLGIDSHPSVGFKAPFEPDKADFRERFRPFSFKKVTVSIGSELAFTGRLLDVDPPLAPNERKVTISAYSLPAQLEDSDVPARLVPMQTLNLTLSQIAQQLVDPFGFSVVVDGDEGAKFKKVKTHQKKVDGKIEADQKIQDFLGELARQRGLVITSTPEGNLKFWKSIAPGRPVARFVEGVQPLSEIIPTFNPRQYYSEITGFTTAKRGRIGAKFTETNQRLSGGVLRAHNFKLDDVEKADAVTAVKGKIGRMFAAAVSYVIPLPTWRDPKGDLWKPNTTVTVKSPSAMIYKETELLVRDVSLSKSKAEGERARLGLVLPGAFSGEAPPRLPWEE